MNDPGPRFEFADRPCPSCRKAVSHEYIFKLAAFEPDESEITDITGVSMEVDAESDDEEDAGPVKIVKQKNKAVILDSDDEEEMESEPVASSKRGKGKKEEKELPPWMTDQLPSTKMLWLSDEIKRYSSLSFSYI